MTLERGGFWGEKLRFCALAHTSFLANLVSDLIGFGLKFEGKGQVCDVYFVKFRGKKLIIVHHHGK